jgi:hypothetical protein
VSIQLAEAALSPQKLGGSGRRHGVVARSRDVEMIGVPTSAAIDAVGGKKGHMRLAGGL